MNSSSHRAQYSFWRTLSVACRAACQWRILLLWVVVMLLPTIIMTLPFAQILAKQLDYSVHASQLAQRLPFNSMGDLIGAFMTHGMLISQFQIVAVALTLLLMPFLNGALITAIRAETSSNSPAHFLTQYSTHSAITFGQLMHGGIAEYGRMLRLAFVMLIPIGLIFGVISGLLNVADNVSEAAIIQADADKASHLVFLVSLFVMVLMHATIEAARAQFAISTQHRSALKAWWRGITLVARRPFSTLGLYGLPIVMGGIILMLLTYCRINLPHVNTLSLIAAWVLSQLIAATIVWIHCVRLFALAELCQAQSA